MTDIDGVEGWRRYFYHQVPQLLTEQMIRRELVHAGCPHTRAPKERRLLLGGLSDDVRDYPFMWSWYALTLLDQTIFSHFPHADEAWHRAVGNYPLPMVEVGFGCLHVAAPRDLLRTGAGVRTPSHASAEWAAFVHFFVEEVREHLEQKSGVGAEEFWAALASEREFGSNDGGYEQALFRHAVG